MSASRILKPLCLSACIFVLFAGMAPKIAAQEKSKVVAETPLVFEENRGQVPAPYRFLARRGSVETLFGVDGVDVLVPKSQTVTSRLRIEWLGANRNALPTGEERLPGHSNYLHGSDSTRWFRGIPQYGRVQYAEIYPGVDLLFHGTGDELEQDFVVQPGASPDQIALRLDRAAHLTPSGDLDVALGHSKLRLLRPVAYQDFGAVRKNVNARFVLGPHGRVKFQVGEYDRTRPLVIDPVFGFSTYLAGTGSDLISAVTTDVAGNVYVTGSTNSIDFPIVNGEQPVCASCTDFDNDADAFISKFDPTGHTLLYSTYVGGSNGDTGYSIALDQTGDILVSGISGSSDFPHAGSVQSLTCQTNDNCFFVLSLTPDGSAFNYSGLIGGIGGNYVYGNPAPLAIDKDGNAYLAGTTDDANFQLTPGTLGPIFSGYPYNAAFAMKVDPTGKLVYSTVIPGNAPQNPASVFANYFPPAGISVDADGQVTLAGYGGTGLPTTPGVLQPTFPNNAESGEGTAGYILQLNATASALNYATYITGTDYVYGLAVDQSGDSYVTGYTDELNLPVSANAFQKSLSTTPLCGCSDGFIAEVDGQGKAVLAATYLSGAQSYNYTSFTGVALDSKSNVFVGGLTSAADFPLHNPIVTTLVTSFTSSGTVLAQLSPDLSSLLFGSFLSAPDGGSRFEGLTMDSQDNAIVVGITVATDFPTTTGSFQTAPPPPTSPYSSMNHSFVSKINLSTPAPSVCLNTLSINFGTPPVNTPFSQNLNVQNCGNAPLEISAITSSSSTVTATQTCGSIAAGATCVVQLTFTPPDTNGVYGTITLSDNAVISQQTITFSGSGGIPIVYFPPSYTVSDLLVGTQAEFYIPLSNDGNANWIITSATITGDFSLDNTCTAPVIPGAACTMGVIFAPTQTGVRTGTLTITDNVAGSPHTISVSGNGISTYPVPSISEITAFPTDSAFPYLAVNGNSFFPGSQAMVNGTTRTAFYSSEQFLFVTLTPADFAQMGELSITISNPAPGGGISNAYIATVYAPIRNIGILQTVYEPISGMVYASVSTQSANYANQVVVINPATAKVVNSWSVGNGPNQLAVSGDGQFLYVGLDADAKVAQVSLPSGTFNFTAGLGLDPTFNNPMIADAIRVLPGMPHSWAVTLCGVGYIPCGEGIAVFDDAVERPTVVLLSQLQPDSLVFVGNNAATLYGITLQQSPATFYEFSINSSGITKTNSVTNYSGPFLDGGYLDTDGTSIYISNGEVVNPTTLAVQSNFVGIPGYAGIKVDAPASRVYFAGLINNFSSDFYFGYGVEAFGLANQQLLGSIFMNENIQTQNMFRWGTNGLGISGSGTIFLMSTSLTATSPQISISGATSATVNSGTAASYGLSVAPLGGFAGTVNFSCSNLPQYASCSFTPSSTTLAGAAVSVTATVSTSQSQANSLGRDSNGIVFAGIPWLAVLVLLPCCGLKSIRRRFRWATVTTALLVIVLTLLPLAACGSGGSMMGGVNPPPPPLDTPKGTYTINLTATGNGASQTIQLTLTVQ